MLHYIQARGELGKSSAKQQQGHTQQEPSYDCEERFTGEHFQAWQNVLPWQQDGGMSCTQQHF